MTFTIETLRELAYGEAFEPHTPGAQRDLARELLLLRARIAYVAQHGGAWEVRVLQGECDDVVLGLAKERE